MFRRQDTLAFMESHRNFFSDIGGVTNFFLSLHPIKVVHFLVTKLVKFLMIIYTSIWLFL